MAFLVEHQPVMLQDGLVYLDRFKQTDDLGLPLHHIVLRGYQLSFILNLPDLQ